MTTAASNGRLTGKRAIVTGGGSGIGAAIVERFRAESAHVVSTDIRGGDVTMDVRSRASVEDGVRKAVEQLGGLDVLVCNAGRPIVGRLHELEEAAWDDGIDTNLKSVYLTAHASWPHLVESRGVVLSTASAVGLWGSGEQAAYCATKAGVVMLTKCMALDGARDGVRANCVCPGFTETPLLERFMSGLPDPDAAQRSALALHPLGRLGRPRDIADAFVFLASDEASWVTGVALPVDGGLTVGIW